MRASVEEILGERAFDDECLADSPFIKCSSLV
mgnify:CR=1 FL=1